MITTIAEVLINVEEHLKDGACVVVLFCNIPSIYQCLSFQM